MFQVDTVLWNIEIRLQKQTISPFSNLIFPDKDILQKVLSKLSIIEMESLWQSKNYLKNDASLFNRECVNRRNLDFSKEVLRVSVGQRAAKLWSVKLWRWSDHPGLEPGLPAFGSNPAAWQDFFQISNFDSLYFCSPLTYRDPQYLFGKI